MHATRRCEAVYPDPETPHRCPPAQEGGESLEYSERYVWVPFTCSILVLVNTKKLDSDSIIIPQQHQGLVVLVLLLCLLILCSDAPLASCFISSPSDFHKCPAEFHYVTLISFLRSIILTFVHPQAPTPPPHPPPSSLSVCQTLVKEAVVHPLEMEPGQFLPQAEQSLVPPLAPPQTASHSGRARISLSVSVGPAPVLPPTMTRSALTPRPPTLEDGMRGREGWRERGGGREKWGVTKERVRGRLSQQKERKATQMLAIVLGERKKQQAEAQTRF